MLALTLTLTDLCAAILVLPTAHRYYQILPATL
jgi:hypothetical protein